MRYLMLVVMIILSGCASKFEGNSFGATVEREGAADRLLITFSPDNCTYDRRFAVYKCDNEETATNINKRVTRTRWKIISQLYNDPRLKNKNALGLIILGSLYHCRDENGNIPAINETAIYCKTQLPAVMRNEPDLISLGKGYGGTYKYVGSK